MIMPSKYIKEDEALLGVGATLLKHLNGKTTLSILWEDVKHAESVCTFERFILALDLLFLLGLVDIHRNEITRAVL
jgi:hypothetical protein